MVKQLEKDLPELLNFFDCLKHLRKKVRTTNLIERCFVEVRRRTRPMVVFVNIHSVDRINLSELSFSDLIMSGKTAPSNFLNTQLDVTWEAAFLVESGPGSYNQDRFLKHLHSLPMNFVLASSFP